VKDGGTALRRPTLNSSRSPPYHPATASCFAARIPRTPGPLVVDVAALPSAAVGLLLSFCGERELVYSTEHALYTGPCLLLLLLLFRTRNRRPTHSLLFHLVFSSSVSSSSPPPLSLSLYLSCSMNDYYLRFIPFRICVNQKISILSKFFDRLLNSLSYY